MQGHSSIPCNISVRLFRIEDYDNLITLWDEAKLPYKPKGRDTKENIAREIKQPNALFLIAEKDSRLIGSAFGTYDGRKGWINRVAVAPKYRRKRIAAKLVGEVENRLSEMGIGIIACLIEDWNKSSIKFFEQIGYKRHKDIIYFTKRRDPDI